MQNFPYFWPHIHTGHHPLALPYRCVMYRPNAFRRGVQSCSVLVKHDHRQTVEDRRQILLAIQIVYQINYIKAELAQLLAYHTII